MAQNNRRLSQLLDANHKNNLNSQQELDLSDTAKLMQPYKNHILSKQLSEKKFKNKIDSSNGSNGGFNMHKKEVGRGAHKINEES